MLVQFGPLWQNCSHHNQSLQANVLVAQIRVWTTQKLFPNSSHP